MAPLLGLTRTRVLAGKPSLFRQINSHVSTKSSGRAPVAWGAQWRRVGGTFMMYVPVVGVLMFWPYSVKPVMDRIRS